MPDISSIVAQLEQKRAAIDNALAALRGIGGEPPATKRRGRPPRAKKAGMSDEGRQRQAEAMRAY